MSDDDEIIQTPAGDVTLPPMSAFAPIYCRACGCVLGGCDLSTGPLDPEILVSVWCPACDKHDATLDRTEIEENATRRGQAVRFEVDKETAE